MIKANRTTVKDDNDIIKDALVAVVRERPHNFIKIPIPEKPIPKTKK